MVKYVILLIVLAPIVVIAQTTDTTFISIDFAEEMPVYKDSLELFIQSNICYPESACIDSVEGKVFIQYYVETDGTTSNHSILRGIREDLNCEAIRVARLIVYDEPARERGTPVKIRRFIPVVFKLQNCKAID